jgi:acetyl esterase/lipase
MVALAALQHSAIPQTATQLPAFLISHGSADFPHLMTQAGQFVQALRQAGASVEHLEMAGRTHFTAHFASAEPDGPWLAPALAFMARHAVA